MKTETTGISQRRNDRALQQPIVDGLPALPGINAAMGISNEIGNALRGVAQQVLVEDLPGATLTRGERELLATGVSAGNGCFFCMDSHAEFAKELLSREGDDRDLQEVVDKVKLLSYDELEPKMQALMIVAEKVRLDPLGLTRADVDFALENQATDQDVQLAVLIASAFSMFNRLVDGFRAVTPPNLEMYKQSVARIADHGYLSSK